MPVTARDVPSPPAADGPVVLFDGVCNLCNGWVAFLVDRDPAGVFRFASLQSQAACALLAARRYEGPAPGGSPSTMLLIEGQRVFERSSAVLRILARLPPPWPWARILGVVPQVVRDAVYDTVARNRYRWFGRTEACRVPTPELRRRFLAD